MWKLFSAYNCNFHDLLAHYQNAYAVALAEGRELPDPDQFFIKFLDVLPDVPVASLTQSTKKLHKTVKEAFLAGCKRNNIKPKAYGQSDYLQIRTFNECQQLIAQKKPNMESHSHQTVRPMFYTLRQKVCQVYRKKNCAHVLSTSTKSFNSRSICACRLSSLPRRRRPASGKLTLDVLTRL